VVPSGPWKIRNISSSGQLAVKFLTFALAAIGMVAGVRWGWLLISHSSTGLDVTDEGYYLSAVEFPGAIPHAPTDYGAYLRNVWLLTGRDIPLFRIAGLLLIVCSSCLFSLILHQHQSFSSRMSKWTTITVTASIVLAGSCYQYVLWIVTPNYNLLTLVILLPIAGLLVRLLVPASGASPVGQRWALDSRHVGLGAGVILLFAVRFSAAILVLLVYLAVLAFVPARTSRRLSIRSFRCGLAIGLVIHLLLARRWPWTSAQLWLRSLELSNLRNDHPPSVIWEVDFFRSDVAPWLPWGITVLAFSIFLRILIRRNPARRAVSIAMAAIAIFAMWPTRPQGGVHAADLGVGWWWLRFFFYVSMAMTLLPERLSRRDLVGPTVMLLGVSGALGSANGVFRQMIFMMGLLVAGVVAQAVTSSHQGDQDATVFVPATGALCMILLIVLSSAGDAVEAPYRLQ